MPILTPPSRRLDTNGDYMKYENIISVDEFKRITPEVFLSGVNASVHTKLNSLVDVLEGGVFMQTTIDLCLTELDLTTAKIYPSEMRDLFMLLNDGSFVQLRIYNRSDPDTILTTETPSGNMWIREEIEKLARGKKNFNFILFARLHEKFFDLAKQLKLHDSSFNKQTKWESDQIVVKNLPENAKWENLTLRFLNVQNVIVLYDNRTIGETTSSAMGFADKKSQDESPNRQWRLLRILGQFNGELPLRIMDELSPTGKNSIQQQKLKLATGLEKYFPDIEGNPFFKQQDQNAYYTIKIHIKLEDNISEDRERELREFFGKKLLATKKFIN